jgi:hypothetical protein
VTRLSFALAAVAVTLPLALASCTPPLPLRTSSGISTEYEPPRSWAGAVTFMFLDSVQQPDADFRMTISFHDGQRMRTLTTRDVISWDNGDFRTRWYRLYAPADSEPATTFLIKAQHASGAETIAEYPLTLDRRAAYRIAAVVQTYVPDPTRPSPWVSGRRSYPLHPTAAHPPSDSLWVLYTTRSRECWRCPT